MKSDFILICENIEDSVFLPSDWDSAVIECAKANSIYTELNGRSVTSREDGEVKIPVRVTAGDVIFNRLPWLFDLYRKNLLDKINRVSGKQYVIDGNIKSSININYIIVLIPKIY